MFELQKKIGDTTVWQHNIIFGIVKLFVANDSRLLVSSFNVIANSIDVWHIPQAPAATQPAEYTTIRWSALLCLQDRSFDYFIVFKRLEIEYVIYDRNANGGPFFFLFGIVRKKYVRNIRFRHHLGDDGRATILFAKRTLLSISDSALTVVFGKPRRFSNISVLFPTANAKIYLALK